MDLMGLVNQAIASTDTEASSNLMGSVLGALNDAPIENGRIGEVASQVQQVLQSRGDANQLIDVLQTVASAGAVERLLASDQVLAIAQRAGVDPAMVQNLVPIIAQFLVKGSNNQGEGLLQRVINGEVDLGQMAGLISRAGTFLR